MKKLLESQNVEFKQHYKDEYLKTICAFANSNGGVLYIGLDDNGEILGVQNIKELIETLPNKINNRLGLVVDIIHKNEQNKDYLEIIVNKTYAPSSDIVEGNLINQVDTILDILRLKYLKAYISYERAHRREKLEYPYEALREAIINALIHRDYTNTSNLQIRVYDDKLVLYNGATLNPEVPIEKFDKPHQSKPFNPTMASVFYKCGFIENWGKGTINIVNECLEYGLPKPTFEYDWEAVKTTFYKKNEEEGINGGLNGGLNELLKFILKNEGLSAIQISEKLDTPLRTTQRYLKELKDKNKIEYKGSKKTGGYFAK